MLEGLLCAPCRLQAGKLPPQVAPDMVKARSWSQDLAFCG